MASARKKENKTAQRLADLHSEEIEVRKEAALWLGQKGVQEAFVPLLTALQDRSWKVRKNAVKALGYIGNVEAVDFLIMALTDKTLSVQRAAVNALGVLGDARAAESLMHVRLNSPLQLGQDAEKALIQIGAPALLYCSQQMQSENPRVRSHAGATAHAMLRLDSEMLLKEALRREAWSSRERWLVLEATRKVFSDLVFLDVWMWSKFSRITDIPNWCERITRDPSLADLHAGSRQVLDYITLGRASQRDHTMESDELLRAATGTTSRDTGKTLLRASDKSAEVSKPPALMDRLRRWFVMRIR